MTTISVQQSELVHTKLFDAADASVDEAWEGCWSGADARCQFSTLDWYRSWLATIGTRRPWRRRGCILTATTSMGRTIGVLPLAIAERCGVKVISIAGYFQPHRSGIWSVGEEKGAAVAMADFLFGGQLNWDVAHFGPMELSIAGNRVLIERIRLRASRVQLNKMGATIVLSQLPSSFDQYQAQILGLKFAKQIQYFQRRADRENGLRIEQAHSPQGEALDRFLHHCRMIESRSWIAQAQQRYPRFATNLDLEFWRGVSGRGPGSNAYVSFWVMYLKEQPVSYCVTLTAGGVRYAIANQYDEAVSKYSTGSILYFHMVEDACALGVQSINFGGGSAHYKSRWGGVPLGERVTLTAFSACASGKFLGLAYSALTQCKSLAKTLRRRQTIQSSDPSGEN